MTIDEINTQASIRLKEYSLKRSIGNEQDNSRILRPKGINRPIVKTEVTSPMPMSRNEQQRPVFRNYQALDICVNGVFKTIFVAIQ